MNTHLLKTLLVLLIALVSITAQAQTSAVAAPIVRDVNPAAVIGGGANVQPAPLPVAATPGVSLSTTDPTQPSTRMMAAMMAHGSAIPTMGVKGIVIGSSGAGGGLVIFEVAGGSRVLARAGSAFTVLTDGEPHKLLVKGITSDGIEIEAPDQREVAILPIFTPVSRQRANQPGVVSYVEFRDLPLIEALRMLSDQTGNNYSASVEANKIPVNVMLRNVPADSVVEEICKSHNLWFKSDKVSNIMRIMTVAEFEKDLVGFREEQTEVFTLKYPNVAEVTNAIADLYGSRVQISSSPDDIDESSRRDLESRFDRFQVLTQGAQQASAVSGNVLGQTTNGSNSGVGGTYGIGGGFGTSFNSSGGSTTYNGSGYNRNRYEQNRTPPPPLDDGAFRNLTPEQAQRVERSLIAQRRAGDPALTGGAEPDLETLRLHPANIYISSSKRNNMIAVRTSDTRAMEDIRALVTRMDVQTPLVLLEVKVVTIELGNDFRSAFDYQFGNGKTSGSFTSSGTGLSTPATGGGFTAASSNPSDMTFTIASDNFRAQMQLFEQKNLVKTLASPTLLTANNEISRLFLGEERPVVQNISSQTILTDNNVATTPNTTTQFRNVGNTLLITPNINSDRTVTLRLVQENSYITPNGASIPVVTASAQNSTTGNVQNVSVDVVGTRSVSGTFVAKDGMAIAIGGMIEVTESNQRGQVPVLGDIPLVGQLFRRQEKIKSRSELVVIICPHIMSTPADSERITKDLLKRLAPASVDRLTQEGFYPRDNGGVIPKATPVDDILFPPVPPRVTPVGK